MKEKEGVFLSETKMTKQQICDLLVLVKLMLRCADGIYIAKDGLIISYEDKKDILVPNESSIYDIVKCKCGKIEEPK